MYTWFVDLGMLTLSQIKLLGTLEFGNGKYAFDKLSSTTLSGCMYTYCNFGNPKMKNWGECGGEVLLYRYPNYVNKRKGKFCLGNGHPICVLNAKKKGVCHIEALPFTLNSILRKKKNYRNSNISSCKNII